MARARNIKPGFFKNEILGVADPLYSLLFEGLWTLADREGRLEDRPVRIKGELFPYRDGLNVDAMLNWLQENQFITRYKSGQSRFIQVLNFCKHQTPHLKEAASTIPAPDEHGASTVQAPVEESPKPEPALLIADSLIPDSGLSDSGLLIPDSPNHNTSARPTAVRPAKPKADSSDAWEAYAEAYERRYGTPPVRNATVNGQLANFVKRVGIAEAPDIARFYVGLSTAWYVTKGHPVGLLLSDAEKLRTEWATGKTINGTSARRQEATAANPFLELLRDGTHG